METKFQKEYVERLSLRLYKLDLEIDIFWAKAKKAAGLAKAKYLEQIKNIQEKREILNKIMKEIIEGGNQPLKGEFQRKIDNLLKEIDEVTKEKKQRLIDLFG